MRAARIARIGGIDIRVHPLMLVLVALVALDGATAGPGGVWDGVSWLVLVFSCVLVHELAHSVVARRLHVGVRDIVLLPIGGVSEMERLPERPGDELRIAAAGPLTSTALAVAAASLNGLTGGHLFPVDFANGSFLHRLAWFNAVLAGFNLLPAFPLDGGRVLRAALSLRSSLEPATRTAARVGRALALAMGAVGVVANLWLLLIAVFVYVGATAEEAATRAHVRLRGRRVGDVMVAHPICVPAAMPVADVVALERQTAQREFPVVSAAGAYLGMVPAPVLDAAPPLSPVGDHALAVPALRPDEDLEAAAERLGELRAAAAAVEEEGGRVVGLLRMDDVAALLDGNR